MHWCNESCMWNCPEDPDYQPGWVGKLRLALYGTRDAAQLWQECLAEHLHSIGLERGKSNPRVYFHRACGIRVLVHGDDYASAGLLEDLRWMQKELENCFETKTTIVGHANDNDVVAEGQISNRLVRATSCGCEYECNQRHVEVLIE